MTSESSVTLPALVATQPSITGVAEVGKRLAVVAPKWSPAAATVTYQWFSNAVPIAGATASTYVVAPTLVGRRITVMATGFAVGYRATNRSSAATAPVAATPLIAAPTPKIGGTAKVGYDLSANAGVWGPPLVTVKYQWRINGIAVPGATKSGWAVPGTAAGKRVSVTVTGSKTGFITKSMTSASTGIVALGDLKGGTPKVTGTLRVGSTLRVEPGTWGPAPVKFTYQWLLNGKPLATAHSQSWRITSGAVGKTVQVIVTGSRSGYHTKSLWTGQSRRVSR